MVRSLPHAHDMSAPTRYIVVALLAGVMSSCNSSTTPVGPTPSPSPTQTATAPAPTPSPTPSPSPTPAPTPETGYVMSGYVRDHVTNGTIANARLDLIQGINAGKTAWSDSGGLYRFEQLKAGAARVRITAAVYDARESDVSISGDLTMNVQLAPVMAYLYSGIVSDGTGRPVVGATVRGGPNSATTDANGRYEFRSVYSSVPGNVYPPAGYERKPVRFTDAFVLTPGQNITIRRITGLTVSPPATLAVGAQSSVGTQVTFDSGAVESPVLEIIELTSSDSSIVRAGSGSADNDRISIWGVAPGTATITGRYFGVSSAAKPVQVR